MTAPSGLRIESLRKVWPDGTVALDDISLQVAAGDFVAVLGRSGSGKSTLLRAASRLIEPTAGRVFVGDTEVTGTTGRALARARGKVGFVFQQFNLVRSYTAIENVLVARMSHSSWLRGFLGVWTAADREIAKRCLDEVEMGARADAPVRELSGGQQQRVAVARAFAQEPAVIFADEPTASLDPALAETVMQLLKDYGARHRVAVMVNVHTVEHARRFADRVLGLSGGKIVHDAPASDLNAAAVTGIYR